MTTEEEQRVRAKHPDAVLTKSDAGVYFLREFEGGPTLSTSCFGGQGCWFAAANRVG